MAKKIPLVQTNDRNINQLQSNISSAVNPVLANPIVNGNILTGIKLAASSNTIPHKLGANLQGWVIIRQRASATIFDTQDSNASPSTTLLLTASAPVTVDILVF